MVLGIPFVPVPVLAEGTTTSLDSAVSLVLIKGAASSEPRTLLKEKEKPFFLNLSSWMKLYAYTVNVLKFQTLFACQKGLDYKNLS